jgi:pimeloyl-ACP methyl ester carboxylesterase
MHMVETSFGAVAYTSRGQGQAIGEQRVIAIDWPGYGDSPAPSPPESASARKYAALLRELLERLQLGPAILIGNSVGGFAALRAALDRPQHVRAIVLVDPGGFTRHNVLTRAFVRLKGTQWFTRRIAGRFARHYLVRRTPWTKAIIERADRERLDPVRVAVDAAVWRSFLEPGHDLSSAAASLAVPTLIVWGRRDPNVPLRRDGAVARAALPAATFVEVDTGHAPQAEDPEAFLAAVLPFLARCREAPTTSPARS